MVVYLCFFNVQNLFPSHTGDLLTARPSPSAIANPELDNQEQGSPTYFHLIIPQSDYSPRLVANNSHNPWNLFRKPNLNSRFLSRSCNIHNFHVRLARKPSSTMTVFLFRAHNLHLGPFRGFETCTDILKRVLV